MFETDESVEALRSVAVESNLIHRTKVYTMRVAIVLLVSAVWEIAARWWIDPFWISMPSLVMGRLGELIETGLLWSHLWATASEALLGLLLGVVVGIAAGLLLSRYQNLLLVLEPLILGIYSLPRVALAPLFVLWFGLGLTSKVAMVFSLVVFIILFNTIEGMRSINPDLIDVMRVMDASDLEMTRRVIMPSLLGWIVAGVRISVGMALIGAVVGELVGSTDGLGYYVARAQGAYDTTGIFAGLLALLVLAVLFNEVVKFGERRAFQWRPSITFENRLK